MSELVKFAFLCIVIYILEGKSVNGAPAHTHTHTQTHTNNFTAEIEMKLAHMLETIQFMHSGINRDLAALKQGQLELKYLAQGKTPPSLATQTQTASAAQLSSPGRAGTGTTGTGGSNVGTEQIKKAKLTFKVSGRKFPDKDTGIGTSDGYFELFWSEDGGQTRNKIGRSDTIADQENPDWGNTFSYDFDRTKEQLWYFKVYDEDHFREDDNIGRVWVNVKDYVDKGQFASVNLHKQGYLIIKSTEPLRQNPSVPAGSMPIPAGIPTTQSLKFKVSASGLPSKDDVGFIPGSSDPYVIIYLTEGPDGAEKQIGRSATVSNTKNPVWGDVFTVPWDSKKDQRLHFKIYDDDRLRDDDKLGGGWLELNDYVAHGQAISFYTPKGGKITVSKA